MKLLVKLLVITLAIAALLPFTILKGKDGKTLMQFSDIKWPNTPTLDNVKDIATQSKSKLQEITRQPKEKLEEVTTKTKEKLQEITAPTKSTTSRLIYQWTDSRGNMQFSNHPPEEGINYSVKDYDLNENVIQSVSPKSIEPIEKKPVTNTQADKSKPAMTDKTSNTFSIKEASTVLKNAKGIENLLQQRSKNQDAIIDQEY